MSGERATTDIDLPSPALEELQQDIRGQQLVPGWNRPGDPPLWDSPLDSFHPVVWRYEAARTLLNRAAQLVSVELAERRNLIMANPLAGNTYATTCTQVLAYQLLLPGEQARTHRHSPHAGRLVLESDGGAYTVVDGVKIPMQRGDVVLTPGWSWHGHGHEGVDAACWIDFLDVPTVQLLEPMFFEPYPDGFVQEAETESRQSPLLFPYEETQKRLATASPDPSGWHGRRIELGTPALPTIGLFVDRYDPSFVSRAYRTSANYQYCVIEGAGSSVVDGRELEWSRGDVIVVPAWRTQQHRSADGATVLAVTDEPLQRYCGYLRTSDDVDARLLGAAHAPLP
jgi:gentisate 1,2-dioxygenase